MNMLKDKIKKFGEKTRRIDTGDHFKIFDMLQKQLETSYLATHAEGISPSVITTLLTVMDERDLGKENALKWLPESMRIIHKRVVKGLYDALKQPVTEVGESFMKNVIFIMALFSGRLEETAPLKEKKTEIEKNRVKDFYLELCLTLLQSSKILKNHLYEMAKVITQEEKNIKPVAAFLELYGLMWLIALGTDGDDVRMGTLLEELKEDILEAITILKSYVSSSLLLEEIEGALEKGETKEILDVLERVAQQSKVDFVLLKDDTLKFKQKVMQMLDMCRAKNILSTDHKTHLHFVA